MMDFSKKKWIIFDLDGTIIKMGVDWPGCRKEVREVLLKKYPNLEIIFEKKESELGKQNKKLTIELMGWLAYKELGCDVYGDFQSIQERYETSYSLEQAKAYDNVVKFIKNNQAKFKYAICSNNSLPGIEYTLNLFALLDKFSLIEARQVGRPLKPEPQILADILKKINLEKEEIFYVGDNDFTDRMLAESMGIDYLNYNQI